MQEITRLAEGNENTGEIYGKNSTFSLQIIHLPGVSTGCEKTAGFSLYVTVDITVSSINFRVATHRVILRQGHIGHSFYFIFSGSVFVNLEDTDPLGRNFVKTEAILMKGDSFGVSLSQESISGGTAFKTVLTN